VTDELSSMSASELGPLIRTREVSPVQLVEAQLARIAGMDDVLRAFTYVDAEGGLAQARAAEAEIVAGAYRGPLHGITVAHKDIIDVRGMPTTAASRVIPHAVATRDATVGAKLRGEGTVALGKLNLIEFASGSMGVFGFARNPWNLSAYPGGSSSGSGAALAAGMVTLATGTDTGGSIRNPAAFCGLAGLRPTYGRVSRAGCIPLSWSQDSIGPMARTVADVALMLGAMAGPDGEDLTAAAGPVPDFTEDLGVDIAGVRVGVPHGYFMDGLDPEVAAAMHAAIRQLTSLGADVIPIELPASVFAPAASWTIAYSESFVFHRPWFETKSRDYTPAFFHKIAAAGLMSAEERIVGQQIRQRVTREFLDAFQRVDLIVTPANRALASDETGPPAQSLRWTGEMASVTRPVSLTGFPALSVPIGLARDNTPIGMQVVGRRWDEAAVLALGHAYEQSTPWHKARPPALPAEIPPRFGAAGPPAPAPHDAGAVTAGWVMDMARLLGHGFVNEADAEAMAPLLTPVKAQLALARATLALDLEPPVRPAGFPW